jgi:hypothetical protein
MQRKNLLGGPLLESSLGDYLYIGESRITPAKAHPDFNTDSCVVSVYTSTTSGCVLLRSAMLCSDCRAESEGKRS